MMLNKILDALKSHRDLAGWSVSEIRTRGSQLYAVPKAVEAARQVDGEKYKVHVFCQGKGADGAATMGRGEITILPGGDIEAAIEQAALIAGLVSNPVYTLPAPSPLPDVDLVDPDLKADPQAAMQSMMEQMRRAGAATKGVRMTAAECFGDVIQTRLVNSRGIDAQQEETLTSLEFVLMAGKKGAEVESFAEMTRRRPRDLDVESAIERKARLTADLLAAGPAPEWQGPVIMRDETLAGVIAGDDLNGSVLQTLADAGSKYSKISPWELGQPVFRGEVKGDPFTAWANRSLPFGTGSNRFDDEGLPAMRLELIRDNVLVNFSASQKYADYMNLRPTGAFGILELPPGMLHAADLLNEPYVEIVQFSWFNPDPITGDFATEIRLGYLVEKGVRKPFKGGQLIGNFMDALADVRWSSETKFLGSYLGPHTARFNDLKIAA